MFRLSLVIFLVNSILVNPLVTVKELGTSNAQSELFGLLLCQETIMDHHTLTASLKSGLKTERGSRSSLYADLAYLHTAYEVLCLRSFGRLKLFH